MATGFAVLDLKTYPSGFISSPPVSQLSVSGLLKWCCRRIVEVTCDWLWSHVRSYELGCELVWNFLESDVRMAPQVADRWCHTTPPPPVSSRRLVPVWHKLPPSLFFPTTRLLSKIHTSMHEWFICYNYLPQICFERLFILNSKMANILGDRVVILQDLGRIQSKKL